VDKVVESAVYFSIYLLTDGKVNLFDNLYLECLIESTEGMICQRETRKAEDAMRDQHLI
jgi:hypothetical protein